MEGEDAWKININEMDVLRTYALKGAIVVGACSGLAQH